MSKVECYKCKYKGHFKRDCPDRKDNRAKQGKVSIDIVDLIEAPVVT